MSYAAVAEELIFRCTFVAKMDKPPSTAAIVASGREDDVFRYLCLTQFPYQTQGIVIVRKFLPVCLKEEISWEIKRQRPAISNLTVYGDFDDFALLRVCHGELIGLTPEQKQYVKEHPFSIGKIPMRFL